MFSSLQYMTQEGPWPLIYTIIRGNYIPRAIIKTVWSKIIQVHDMMTSLDLYSQLQMLFKKGLCISLFFITKMKYLRESTQKKKFLLALGVPVHE